MSEENTIADTDGNIAHSVLREYSKTVGEQKINSSIIFLAGLPVGIFFLMHLAVPQDEIETKVITLITIVICLVNYHLAVRKYYNNNRLIERAIKFIKSNDKLKEQHLPTKTMHETFRSDNFRSIQNLITNCMNDHEELLGDIEKREKEAQKKLQKQKTKECHIEDSELQKSLEAIIKYHKEIIRCF